MRVLFDTNIIIDVLLNREPFATDSVKAMNLAEAREIESYLCATTVTTIYYLVARHYDKSHAIEKIATLLKIFDVAPVNYLAIDRAVGSKFSDFEDAVLYESAMLVDADAMVTRNTKDFKAAKLTIYTLDELLATFTINKPEMD